MNLLGEDFTSSPENNSIAENTSPSSALLDLQWPTNSDFFNSNFMPSNFILEGNINFKESDVTQEEHTSSIDKKENEIPNKDKNNAHMSWLSLFAELDPLANQDITNSDGDRA